MGADGANHLLLASELVTSEGDSETLWLPAYGASALFVPDPTGGCQPGPVVRVFFTGLDGWQFRVHNGPSGYGHTAAPRAGGESALPAVPNFELPAADVREYESRFRSLLATMQERTGSQRHATLNDDKGHQRTPAFILSVLMDSLDYALIRDDKTHPSPESKARGGFTDVGLHTGGEPRNTSWPLVSATFCTALQLRHGADPHLLHASALALLDARVLGGLLSSMRSGGPSDLKPRFLNEAALVLESGVTRAAELVTLQHAHGIRDEGQYFLTEFRRLRDELAGARCDCG